MFASATISKLTRQSRALGRCERGGAATEFALIAVVFLTMVLGTIDLGRFYFTRSNIEFAGERVLREAMVSRTVSPSELEQSLREQLGGVGGETSLGVTVQSQPASNPDFQIVTLQVEYPYQSVTPFLGRTPWSISVTTSKTVLVTS